MSTLLIQHDVIVLTFSEFKYSCRLSTSEIYNNTPLLDGTTRGSVDPTINPKKLMVIRIEPVE